ncbi:hypothetical protein [Natronorubrum sp. FCH18a]|uniref:hypothetical protein n=1 Tax=Natronorubrum sp. FCH18a TaxID=3447018 RepID=UPI003F519C64
MSESSPDRFGPFHYAGPDGFEAWGYRFPSGFLILEWISDSVPEDNSKLQEGHQSLYHSFEDFRTTCTGDIEWGRTPNAELKRGLYGKYNVFKDGEPVENCFVLEPETDEAARAALKAYAMATKNEELTEDLRERVDGLEERDRDAE